MVNEAIFGQDQRAAIVLLYDANGNIVHGHYHEADGRTRVGARLPKSGFSAAG